MVEQATTKLGNTFKWLPNNSFERYSVVKPCILEHPQTGKKVWYVLSLAIFLFLLSSKSYTYAKSRFNNIHFSHPASWKTTKEFLTSYVTYLCCMFCLFVFFEKPKVMEMEKK